MSYIALARKWRPRTFSQLVGQEHINKALSNSLNQNRLHHAYLFTGTRGVGKTSVARLLAKALNCEQGISASPCLQCETCLAIEQGRFMDLIEIDGASRTRVEDTREILENVQYVPTSGRFKIYLIDEVHMLSQHSFNALLKTLEEPPGHVKFLLATTDPQKLPVTVLSRCLQFNLKHLQEAVIYQQLELILADEKLSFDKAAVDLLAKAARGSMRDALSLLDQGIASCEGHIGVQDIRNMLGYTQQDYALQLLQALAVSDPQNLMIISKQITAEGGYFHYVINEMLSYLHQINLSQNLPHNNPLLKYSAEVLELAKQFLPEDVQLFYQIGIKGSEDLQLAPTLEIGFEMMLLRMYTFRPAMTEMVPPLHYQTIQKDSNELHHAELKSVNYCLAEGSVDLAGKPSSVDLKVNPTKSPNTTPPEGLLQPSDTPASVDWSFILSQLKLSGLALTAAEHAEFINKSGLQVNLRVAKGHQSVFTDAVKKRIEQGLTNYYKEAVKLNIICEEIVLSSPAQQRQATQKKVHEEAETSLQGDAFFQQLQEEFSAELVKNSIMPVKDVL